MKLVAAVALVAIFCSSTLGMAEGPVPFKALMQEAGAQPAVSPRQDAKDSPVQSTQSKQTNRGKAERVTGGILLGTGVAVITTTLVLVGAAHGSAGHDGRVWAGVGGGAGISGVGVTLIVLGNRKRRSN